MGTLICPDDFYAPEVAPSFYRDARGHAVPGFDTEWLGEVADMVGMTIAAEAILAGEAGLAYAAVCMVDNWANGVLDNRLTVEEYRRGRDQTAGVLAECLGYVLPALSGELPGS